jgi:hypothetical protein
MVPFLPWAPDQATLEVDASQDIRNVIAAETGFRPFPDFSPITAAIPARVRGAFACRATTLGVHNFAGTATKMYKLDTGGLTWTEVTRASGGNYATTTEEWWDFAQFGNYVIATNLADDVQVFEVGTDTEFSALSGSPPKASYVGVIKDFVVLARLSTSYNSIQWSAINDPEDWTPSAGTMADSQTFPEGGQVMGFVGGEYGVVLQERAINRMVFEGPPTIFRFDKVATNVGCRIGKSVASYGNLVFFLSDNGFKMLEGGSSLTDIGNGIVDQYFERDFNSSYDYRLSAAIDPVNKVYIVSYPSGGSAQCDAMLIYHWPTQQWTRADITLEMVHPAFTQTSFTIDTMNLVSATIDGLTYPVDSRFWGGSARLLLAGFDTDHKLGYFSGANLAARIDTKDVQLVPGRKALVRGVRPVIEGNNVEPEIKVGYRNNISDPLQWVDASFINNNGYCPVRANGRYHRIRTVIPAGSTWTLARGIDDVKFSPMGAV